MTAEMPCQTANLLREKGLHDQAMAAFGTECERLLRGPA
jgi:hypothetical protein